MTFTVFLIEAAGWAGAGLILGAYILLSACKMQGNSPVYQWMNVIGAAGFILNSGYNGAIPSMVLNIIWVGIGVFALRRIYKGASAA